MNHERPHAGEQRLWILGIHHQIRAAAVFIGEENAIPGLPTIRRAKDAALLLRPVRVTNRTGHDDVWVLRINDEVPDSARLFHAHQCPRLSRITRSSISLPLSDFTP